MKYRTLNNGVQMPMMGFGTYQIPLEDTERCVTEALEAGYRMIDTAEQYQNEAGVGKALAKTKIPRKELFITTKIWISHFGYEQTKQAIKDSLKRLQLDYIDLVLIHWPFNDYYGAWKALEEAVEQGKIKSIGVSNFSQEQVEDLMIWNKVKPVINQIELNPWYQRPDDVKFLKSKDVAVESWASFAEGKDDIFTNKTLANIGKKYDKTPAQVILRWLIQEDITVIPKSVHSDRMKQNFDIWDFELTDEDINEIRKLNKNKTNFWNADDPNTADYMAKQPTD